ASSGVAAMTRPRFRAYPVKGPRTEAGAALLAFLLVLLVGGSYVLLRDAKSLAQRAKLEEMLKTSEALAEAKAALIGYAAGTNIVPDDTTSNSCGAQCPRPGDLPCPDRNNDGFADRPCGGVPATRRLGRLPWKTLGVADLRDGSGERLWYAVSTNFKHFPKTACGLSTAATCLNSRTRGTITVRNATGNGFRHNGNDPRDSLDPTGATAVILAPGPILRRQGTSASQDRVCSNCTVNERCLGTPPTTVPRCNPANYLDRRQTPSPSENNADFTDASSTDAFIEGPVYDSQGNLIINDRLAVITYYDIMPLLEKRVVSEVSNCLDAYAAENLNRYPWTAALNTSSPPQYGDGADIRFGRVPDGLPDPGPPDVQWTDPPVSPIEQFTVTRSTSGNQMAKSWPLAECLMVSRESKNTWWLNWKEEVFYGVSDAFKPAGTAAPGPSDDSACAAPFACLTLGSSAPPKRFLVIAAGKRLVGQNETFNDNARKGNVANYLELENTTFVPNVDETFTSGRVTASFDDVVGYFSKP
ncbi:MAG: hypothetical protein ACREBC_14590, partial [Pyrinomonadaceae bacterium]